MVSTDFLKYEVLSILGGDINSTCYKVKNKETSEIFVWRGINYENYSESEKQSLINEIEKQKSVECPHLLKVFDYILHEQIKVAYVVTEYCNKENLNSIVHKCLQENQYLHEDFLWQMLYKICCTIKILGKLDVILNLNNVFVDETYQVKLLADVESISIAQKNENLNVEDLGLLMMELCTFKYHKRSYKKNNEEVKEMLTEISDYYSQELKEMLKFILLTNFDMKSMTDAVLCHPTILLKSTQAKKDTIYVNKVVLTSKNEPSLIDSNQDNLHNSELESLYRTKLENIKNRETALKIREEKLTAKLHHLHKQEKKVALMERMVKEKMLHAELYLKRSRESKTTISKQSAKVVEDFDNTYVAVNGDSSFIVPTSKRLVCENIKKPSAFTRTLSERRVRFKGHSPLKDMYNFGRTHHFQNSQLTIISDASTATSSDKSAETNKTYEGSLKQSKSKKRLDLFSMLSNKSRKSLMERNEQVNIIEEDGENKPDSVSYRPISWTDETKQQAFDLLRIMNKGKENEPIKHTYL